MTNSQPIQFCPACEKEWAEPNNRVQDVRDTSDNMEAFSSAAAAGDNDNCIAS